MKRRCNLRNWTGRAVLASLLLIPGLAHAANSCLNITPSFSYTPVVAAGGQATLGISAPPGCLWEVVTHSAWIRIVTVNHGYGPGAVVFQVLPNPTGRPRRGSFGSPEVLLNPLPGRSSPGYFSKFTVTVDQHAR